LTERLSDVAISPKPAERVSEDAVDLLRQRTTLIGRHLHGGIEPVKFSKRKKSLARDDAVGVVNPFDMSMGTEVSAEVGT
jgi:hypothetical protein